VEAVLNNIYTGQEVKEDGKGNKGKVAGRGKKEGINISKEEQEEK
jgi:hypothetical protein